MIKRKKSDNPQEQVWALPYETLVRVLMYRKDAFRKAGLDPNKPPRNWQEYYDYARRLTIPSEGAFGTILAAGPQAAYDWIQFLWAAGGDAVKFDPQTEEWSASFGSEAGVKAMEFYLKLAATKWKDFSGKPQTGFAIREGEWGYLWQEARSECGWTTSASKTWAVTTIPIFSALHPVLLVPAGMAEVRSIAG